MKRLFLLVALACGVCGLGPSYGTLVPSCPTVACLYPGQSGLFLNAERPASSTRSQQFQVPFSQGQPTANLRIECIWAANPGAFNYQIQDADTDATGNYVTIPTAGTITSAPQAVGSGNYVAVVELAPFKAGYVSLWINTQTANAVNGTCQVTR